MLMGCRTASRVVEKSKETLDSIYLQKKDVKIENDSTLTSISETNFDFGHFLSKINFQFSGQNNNDSATIFISNTDNGIKVEVSGKATAEYKNEQSKSKGSSNQTNLTQLVQNKKENLTEKSQVKVSQKQVDKKSQSKTTGMQFTFWLWIIIISIVVIALWWFFGMPKNGQSSFFS